jgi:CheY-like chemotaxis protein
MVNGASIERAALPTGRAAAERRRAPAVLLVDDDDHDREIYGKILWYNGYDVEYAADGESALDVLGHARFDLVILDIMMPGIDGLDLCRTLKANPDTAATPVLALSGRSQRHYGELARTAGCLLYLEKPVNPLRLFKEVERIVGRAPPPTTPGRGRNHHA